jgi:nicotinamidase/pyrazinamidase
LDVFTVPMTDQALAALGPARVYVYGVATEYCVRAEVLGLRQRGYGVTVATDVLGAMRQEDGDKALAEMRAAGAAMADTQTVLRALAAETED